MSIGATIKKLRRDKNITQEQLAEMLGISTNAVSQWECDKTAPDISHLPILANIFEVSADVLLEIDIAKSKKQSEIKEFTTKYAELHSQGKTEERMNLCRAMQKKYPNDETVRYFLMRVLQNGIEKYGISNGSHSRSVLHLFAQGRQSKSFAVRGYGTSGRRSTITCA